MGKWPQQACTTIFFLIPKNVTSEQPIALMPTMIRWWEALTAPEVAKWQMKYRVEWECHRWSQRRSTAHSLGNLVGDGQVQILGRRRTSRNCCPGPRNGEGFRASQSPCGLGLGDAFQFPKEDIAGALRVLRASEASAVRRMCAGAAPDHLARVKMELLAVLGHKNLSSSCTLERNEQGIRGDGRKRVENVEE